MRGFTTPSAAGDLEARTQAIGRQLLDAAGADRAGLFSRNFWSDRLMNWAMRDAAFKVQLFRFIDVFPSLRSARQVHEHLVDYLTQPGLAAPPGFGLGLKAGGMFKDAAARAIAGRIEAMAGQFIAGVDAASALPRLRELWDRRIAFSVDLLGEACVSHAEAHGYQQRYLDLIESLSAQVAGWPPREVLEEDHLGSVPRVNVSIKVSSLSPRADPIAFEHALDSLYEAIAPILNSAARHGVFVNFDMEHHALKDLTLALFERCSERIEFAAGIALQAYLRSGEADARRLIDWSRRHDRPITVRLVKGAYWDFETIHAEQMGWPSPVWSQKGQTDACFERMTAMLLSAAPRRAGEGGVRLALGSHNARSIAHGLALLEVFQLPGQALEVQMLHGMAEPLKQACVQRGLRLREYVPVGQMIPGMAYLVRRLLENTSNESWLRAGFAADTPIEQLLAAPVAGEDQPVDVLAKAARRHALSPAVAGVGDGEPFFNEPVRDFADTAQRGAFAHAGAAAEVPYVPVNATVGDADQAVERATAAFETWRRTDPLDRANMLLRAAQTMRDHRDELAGMIVREAGKPWRDADADVCEAIDFCTFYARTAPSLFMPRRLGRFAGERNDQWHQPRGVAVIISPWNFPLAICCGMTAAALITGNCAIVKPAEQTPAIAQRMCRMLWEAGVPRDVLHFLPGEGHTVGAALVRDPRIAVIAFTGSKAVGLDIIAAAGVTGETQPHVKRVICEMGGKNAIIVDSSADLDQAVIGVRDSAFGYAGQKCSACSRVIVLDDGYDVFVDRLIEATRCLVIGDPVDPATDVGPLIDVEAADKARSYIALGVEEGKLALQMFPPRACADDPRFVGPHIFTGIEPRHRLAQEEVFGPVLAVMRVRDFDEAIRVANDTAYKLTGGLFSRTPRHLALAHDQFRVGNLYLNRRITGALVGRQPFGGFGLSGVGAKAGGEHYLLQFVEPRVCTENTMRRGFAPEVD